MNIILWLGFLFLVCQQKLNVAGYQNIKTTIVQCYHMYFYIVDNTHDYRSNWKWYTRFYEVK